MSPSGTPSVELLYTCGLVLWDDGTPGFGGYYARIAGFADQGEGRTVDQALERLAAALREHVENWDAEVDEQAHARGRIDQCNRLDEPPLFCWRPCPEGGAGGALIALRRAPRFEGVAA